MYKKEINIIIGDYMKKCACGCGKKIIEKPWHKYEGVPDYLPGHQNRGKKRKKKKIKDVNPKDRQKPYQNGFWIAEQIKNRWISKEQLAKECGVHVSTINRYTKESGINLNRLTEEKARTYEDREELFMVFRPGTKNRPYNIKAKCVFIETKSFGSLHFTHEEGRSFYPVVRKGFVEGVGLGYFSKKQNPVIQEAEIHLKRRGDIYQVDLIKPTIVKAYKSIPIDEQEYTLALKEHFGNVKVVWIKDG